MCLTSDLDWLTAHTDNFKTSLYIALFQPSSILFAFESFRKIFHAILHFGFNTSLRLEKITLLSYIQIVTSDFEDSTGRGPVPFSPARRRLHDKPFS